MCVLIIMFVCSLIYCYSISKLSNTVENRTKIMYAIDVYVTEFDDAQKGLNLLYNMQDFVTTFIRLWDWGCKNILPKEDYELIEPYLKEERQ